MDWCFGALGDMNNVRSLHFDKPVGHQFHQAGHKFFHGCCALEKLNPNRQVFSVAAGGTLDMDAMMRSKPGVTAQYRRPGNPLREKKGDYLEMEIISFGSGVFIQMDDDPLCRSRQ